MDSVKITEITLVSLHLFAVFVGTILWGIFRDKTPLNARRFFFPMTFQSINLIFGLLSIWTFLQPENDIANAIQLFIYPIWLQMYVWRMFELFFLYNITSSRLKHDEIDESSISMDWFIKHRNLISTDFLAKSFLLVSSITYAILIAFFIIGLFQPKNADIVTIILIGLTFVYITCIIILLVKIRKVDDAFYIKKEFIGMCIWILLIIVSYVIVAITIPERMDALSEFSGLILYFGSEFITIYFPLTIAFYTHFQKKKGRSNHASTSSTEVSSIHEILADEATKEVFSSYLSKQFKVEYLLFVEDLKKARAKPKETWGGRVLLLYQRFIKKGAYLYMQIPDENRESIKNELKDEEKLISGDVKSDIFDDAEKYAYVKLDEDLDDFTKDISYSTFKKKQRINAGLASIGVKY